MYFEWLPNAGPTSTSHPYQWQSEISSRNLLLRLDEQGLYISSPWRISRDDPIVSVLWPKFYAAWPSEEQWVGCREVEEGVQKVWEQAQLCLAACASLGSAEPDILSISQFRGTQTQWLRLDELANRHCHLFPGKHTATR